MNIINGTTDPKINPFDLSSTEERPAPAAAAPKTPPAKVFLFGQVATRIWANPNPWGEISWKVDQVRVNNYAGDGRTRRGLYFEDLQDGMRGMYAAKRWIVRTERRRRRNWFWWW